jgi:hypothetical protein
MKLGSVMVIGAFAIGSCQIPALFARSVTLHLRLYNLAQVPDRTLARALGETSRVLAAAGIETVWDVREATSSEGEERSTDFTAASMRVERSLDTREFLVVRLVSGFPYNVKANALGFSLPAARYGAHVTIYYDRTERISLLVPARVHKILGNALAHEIGHVLLGSEEHAESGIMKAVWNRIDYQRIAARFLEFLAPEAQLMRNEVLRRAALTRSTFP